MTISAFHFTLYSCRTNEFIYVDVSNPLSFLVSLSFRKNPRTSGYCNRHFLQLRRSSLFVLVRSSLLLRIKRKFICQQLPADPYLSSSSLSHLLFIFLGPIVYGCITAAPLDSVISSSILFFLGERAHAHPDPLACL